MESGIPRPAFLSGETIKGVSRSLQRERGLMISSNDFRTGVTIELEGSVWRVVEFLHVKPGKGSAFVRTKLKSLEL